DVPALAQAIGRLCDDAHRRTCAAAAPDAVAGITMREHARQACRLYEEVARSAEWEKGGYR
ncbi:MAG TPA: hypothetical protein VLM89_02785, partial [Phycisphaerae bacterium]|nr:hypothetical protein [Phycisphaerae bacterium]